MAISTLSSCKRNTAVVLSKIARNVEHTGNRQEQSQADATIEEKFTTTGICYDKFKQISDGPTFTLIKTTRGQKVSYVLDAFLKKYEVQKNYDEIIEEAYTIYDSEREHSFGTTYYRDYDVSGFEFKSTIERGSNVYERYYFNILK